MLIPPLECLKEPLKPPHTLLLPSLDASTEGQRRGLLDGALLHPHHTPVENEQVKEKDDGKERKEGEVMVLSVGR